MSQPPSRTAVAHLADQRARRSKNQPLKRKPRNHRKEARRVAEGDLAEFLTTWEPLHDIAAVFSQWQPGDRGRPPDLPAVAYLIFGVMYLECGSERRVETALNYQPTWEAVRGALAAQYPGYRGLQPDAQPISRREFWRFRERHGITTGMIADLRDAFREHMAVVATGLGMFNPKTGSTTRPALENTFVGDGTVLRPHWKGTGSDRQINRATGELEPVKFDPDADTFKTGDGEWVKGLKFGFVEAWLPHENERIILDVFHVANKPGRDEAAEAVHSIEALHKHLPHAQATCWDMALHGTHFDTLRRAGLIDIVKVPKTAARKGEKIPPPKHTNGTRRAGHLFQLRDDTTIERNLYTFDGHPHIEVLAEGKRAHLPLTRTRLRHSGHRTGGFRLYGDYQIPDDARVPEPLRGATVAVRLDRTQDDGKYNRAEHLRPVTVHDRDEWDRLYALRPGAESINRWFKQRLNDHRAPAVGHGRIHFMLICGALLNNAKAVLAQQHRLKQAA
ncbi:MAG: hypothetical protein M3Q30_20855 [Actinomycetota bacterium]|nr:hypothetical protein [Actinomycetota bacterium]